MVSRRLERFRKLEAERPPSGDLAPRPAPPPPASHEAVVRRFATDGGDSAALRLRADDGGQAFVRCCHCRLDNHLAAQRCSGCDADLSTDEQRRFNEAFWHKTLEGDSAQRIDAERLTVMQQLAKSEYAQAQRDLANWRSGAIPGLGPAELLRDLGPRSQRALAHSRALAARLGPMMVTALVLNAAALVVMLALRIGFLPWLLVVGLELVVAGLFWGRLTRDSD
jgi:hypothetical protein